MKKLFHFAADRYTKQGLWSLFLMSVFPQHLWTLILVFRDMSWIIKRTNVWDAIGNASYAMVYAFFESVMVFCVLVLMGLITPKRWGVNKRIAFLTVLFLTAAIWGMVSQLLYLWTIWLPQSVLQTIAETGRPLFMLYLISLALVGLTVTLPVFTFLVWKKAIPVTLDFMDRISTLSTLYLFLDVVGLVIVVIRNLS